MKKIIITCMCFMVFSCTASMRRNRTLNKSIKCIDTAVCLLDPNNCRDIRNDLISIKNLIENMKNEK